MNHNVCGMVKQTDREHLEWIYDRLHYVHGENKSFDYMIKLKQIIEDLMPEKSPVDKGYRVPHIDEFVPGFEYEEYHRSEAAVMVGGIISPTKYREYWTEEYVQYPMLFSFLTTIYYEDGGRFTYKPHPFFEGLTKDKKYYQGLINTKQVRVKI